MKLLNMLIVLLFVSCISSNKEPVSDVNVVSHAMGVTKVPKDPKRIVILTGESTEALLALGITPIGAVTSYTPDKSWYPHIAEYMKNVEIVGDERQVNLEKIASLEPDLIIGLKARQENIYTILSKIAPTVFGDKFFGEWKENFFLVGEAVGQQKKATEIMASWEQNMQRLRGQLSDKGVLDKTTALYRFTPKTARYYGNLGFAASIVKELGFKRPPNHDTDQFNYEVSQELIPDMNAEQAFYFVFSDENRRAAYENTTNYLTSILFKNLDHQGQYVYEVDNNVWNKSYGILAAQLVLDEISNIFLN